MNEIFSDNKTISHKLALLITGRKGGYPLKLMDALFQEGFSSVDLCNRLSRYFVL